MTAQLGTKSSREILAEALAHRHSVFLSGDNLGVTFQTYLIKVSETYDHLVIENRIKPRYISRFAQSQRFGLQVGMVRFTTDKVRSDGEHIVYHLKEDSVIEETRQAERFAFTADERVVAEILNPFDGETRLSKSVMDMSATGLSLRTTFDSKLFRPGTQLPTIRVLIDGEPYMQGAGTVVYTRKLMDLGGQLRTQVGVKFEDKK